MKKTRTGGRVAILVTALLLFGCAVPALGKTPERPALQLSVKRADGGACRMEWRGVGYRMPRDTPRLQAVLNRVGKTVHHILLAADEGAPWRCVGAAMALAARANMKIGFVSQPQLAGER